MNSHSNWTSTVIEQIVHNCRGNPEKLETAKKRFAARIRGIEADLENAKTKTDPDFANLARRKIEQARRYLRSDEFGACNYELKLLEDLV